LLPACSIKASVVVFLVLGFLATVVVVVIMCLPYGYKTVYKLFSNGLYLIIIWLLDAYLIVKRLFENSFIQCLKLINGFWVFRFVFNDT
jgi:putative flippase GtrA